MKTISWLTFNKMCLFNESFFSVYHYFKIMWPTVNTAHLQPDVSAYFQKRD